MWKRLRESVWALVLLTVFFAFTAWLILPPAGRLNWTENFLFDAPVRFESGFAVKGRFTVDSAGHFCLLLLRQVSVSGVESIKDFEHQDLVALYQISAEGSTVASGRYPPYTVMTRWKGYDYHSFGGFSAVPRREYEVSLTFSHAAAAAAAVEGRLRVAYDPVYAPDAKSAALLANVLGLAGIISAILLARSLWTTFRNRRTNNI
jgi:hypothetical protein